MIPSACYGLALDRITTETALDSASKELGLRRSQMSFPSYLAGSSGLASLLGAGKSQGFEEPRRQFGTGLGVENRARFHPEILYQASEKPREPLNVTLKKAGKRALGGGLPGAAAMGIQVLSLMWLRTTVNYQYRYGTSTTEALKTLYRDGGIPRFYRGLAPALFQGPLSRFGDTAANAGTLALLDEFDNTKTLPVGVKTMAASGAAAGFRILLMPIDACKTIMQVEGKGGFTKLVNKVRIGGPTVLFHGALAASGATFVGHYPWFFVYNELNANLPQYDELVKRLLRSAFIGFCASAISDTCSNSIRVVKTSKQAATEKTTYPNVVRDIVAKEGMLGLFGRGLKTKIIANGLQGLMFSVLWRVGQDFYAKREKEAEARAAQ